MTAPRIDLAELRRLCEAATPGMLCCKSDGKLLWSVYRGDYPFGEPVASFASHADAVVFLYLLPHVPALLLAVEAAVAIEPSLHTCEGAFCHHVHCVAVRNMFSALAPFRAGEEKGEAK